MPSPETGAGTDGSAQRDWPDLTPDCSQCAALCCVALFLDKGDSFAIDKPAGSPCPNLQANAHGCRIYDRLETSGFGGCRRYDCLGAGQRVTAEVFGGRSWRDDPKELPQMMDAFRQMRALHDLLQLLQACAALPLDPEQTALLGQMHHRLSPPEDGWTLASLEALETSAALEKCRANLQQFRSALVAARQPS